MKPMNLIALAALAAPLAAANDPTPVRAGGWTISADTVYTASGAPIEGGHVVVEGSTIKSVAKGTKSGDGVLSVAAVTPGLIDLGAWMNDGSASTEHSTERPAHHRVADSLDFFSSTWDRELRNGVTSLLAAAPDDAVIGGLGVLLRTGGERTLEARTVKGDAVLRGAVGSRPSSGNRTASSFSTPTHFVRRPTTRMGVEWVWRKSFYDALASEKDESRAFPGSAEILSVIKGERPLMIGAATTQDIRTSIFLKREFGVPNLILQNAAEAWKDPRMVIGSGASVVLPPHTWGGRISTDNAFHAWSTAATLHEGGVQVALSGNGSTAVDGRLSMQPAFAMRGGLPFDAALAAVTINPARMVGADDRVGSLEAGKDADLVLWSGTPFEPTSRVIGVLLNGELVVDPRD